MLMWELFLALTEAQVLISRELASLRAFGKRYYETFLKLVDKTAYLRRKPLRIPT